MNRRAFLNHTSIALSASLDGFYAPWGSSGPQTGTRKEAFHLNYAPHFGMFQAHAGPELEEQLTFMHQAGFSSLEDNDMRLRSEDEQVRIARQMEALDMQMGVFVAHTIGWDTPNLTSGDAAARKGFLDEIRASIKVAQRTGATWMTIVPGLLHPTLEMGYQTAHVVQSLQQASALLEDHGLILVLEPLNHRTDHPGQFLTKTAQAYALCKAVDSPSCKILFDVYHQQITEGNLIPNIDFAWDEIAYIQVGDTPGRNEPTTGEINYKNVFEHLQQKGYEGIIGMEHGNSLPGKKGEQAVIDAYRYCDPA